MYTNRDKLEAAICIILFVWVLFIVTVVTSVSWLLLGLTIVVPAVALTAVTKWPETWWLDSYDYEK